MNEKTPTNCYLAQHGELAGSFCYEDVTLLDNFLLSVFPRQLTKAEALIRKASKVGHF